MKNIKYFKTFESIDEATFRKDLKTYCTEALINLIEIRNYRVYVFKSKDGELDLCIHAFKDVSKWENIKDYIIPFFEIFKDDYQIVEVVKKNEHHTLGIPIVINDILNDEIDDNETISDIEVAVKIKAS